MRILYVNHTSRKSGAGISLGTLIGALDGKVDPWFLLPKDCEIADLLGAKESRRFSMRFMPQAMTTTYNHRLSPLKDAWQFAKVPLCIHETRTVLRKVRPEVIHLNETTLLGHALAAHLLSYPVLIHARTPFNGLKREESMLNWFARLPRIHFACVDDETFRSLPEPCRKVSTVVPNPIKPQPMAGPEAIQSIRAAWGVPPGAILCGQVASLHREKGVWQILELAKSVCGDHPNIYFVLVGDDRPGHGLGPELRAAVEQAGLNQRVLFAGYREDLAAVYGALDIVLCLFGAGLAGVGRTVYEAAIYKKAVLATLPGAQNNKTVRNGINAFLCEPDDLKGLRLSLTKMAGDPGLRHHVAEKLYEQVAPLHDPLHSADTILSLYERLLPDRSFSKT